MKRSVKILKEIPLSGEGDSLENRLKNVTLRGFPDVKIYRNASMIVKKLKSDEIADSMYTPQPHIHQEYLRKIMELDALFGAEGIDIFHLDKAYDYSLQDQNANAVWTILPPVIERTTIPQHKKGGFDYAPLLSRDLQNNMAANGWGINPAVTTADYHNLTRTFSIINDGSHRIHAGLQSGRGITLIELTGISPGYPYYAAPQHYSLVKVFANRDQSKDMKIHVLTEPGHKQLYRDFPSAGIMSGAVRPPRAGESFA